MLTVGQCVKNSFRQLKICGGFSSASTSTQMRNCHPQRPLYSNLIAEPPMCLWYGKMLQATSKPTRPTFHGWYLDGDRLLPAQRYTDSCIACEENCENRDGTMGDNKHEEGSNDQTMESSIFKPMTNCRFIKVKIVLDTTLKTFCI